MNRSLVGLVVAVTGGAAGIGREIAHQLALQGALVCIGDLSGDAARLASRELPGTVHGCELDVTDERSFHDFLATTEALYGPIDVLVNNAGVMWVGSFDTEPDTATARMLAVNLHGVIRGVRLVAPLMRQRGRGHIVTIASLASKVAPAGEATYAATKHGVLGYLTAVREELRGSGVALTAIMPGVVDTELAAGTATGAAGLLTPADVATAVVSAIRQPRFQVTVPAYTGPLMGLVGILPQGLRDAVLRRTVPNQVAAVRDSSSRSEYERRLTD
ncbi:SDR family oxidoreductase [Nocardia camponoti]|uniref:Short-chain dehydrogenase n=1 Tax=Nocardia camponoti TaxID=1616106 RepID=A0A917VBK9_9NOCA|nr:SDR family oxidoreductase [Nocardia camponoti]GGK57892.1 short-chain dehydrogenase [Nocardia camponoti]